MIYSQPELYEQQYKNYDDDFRFYRDLIADYGEPALEIGVGTARLTTHLAKSGYRITGIDNSKEMLVKAKEKIDSLGLNHMIDLKQIDMQYFSFEQQFATIIMPFNAFAHAYNIKMQDKTLSNIKKHLKPGGAFALDMFNPNFSKLEQLKRVDEWQDVGPENSELFVYQSVDKDSQIITSRYYLDTIVDSQVQRNISSLKQRYFYRYELERALSIAGFKNIRFFGDFNKSRYSRNKSQLIVVGH